ncbi:TetR family transcriptional regulator [Bacillus sp. AFS017336]|nr:TetR/AcrR family transcriptional regulator [Bacillus sp. AFS017336]PEK98528.1 TetR family transcriptional regulator [Bacillus sp. AFS017336]
MNKLLQKDNNLQTDRKMLIKQSALKIFALYGYKNAKTSVIATEANVSEGLIFRHFHSKAELFLQIIEGLMIESESELSSLQFFPGTPYQLLTLLTEKMLDENHKYAFMIIQQAKKDNEVPEKVTELLSTYSPDYLIDLLIPIFIKGQESGEFLKEDPRKLLVWYFNVINSLTIQDLVDKKFGLPTTEFLMKMLKV